jgi:hypothetical protein
LDTNLNFGLVLLAHFSFMNTFLLFKKQIKGIKAPKTWCDDIIGFAKLYFSPGVARKGI